MPEENGPSASQHLELADQQQTQKLSLVCGHKWILKLIWLVMMDNLHNLKLLCWCHMSYHSSYNYNCLGNKQTNISNKQMRYKHTETADHGE